MIFNNPGNISTAAAATASQDQHAGANYGGNAGNRDHMFASGAPDGAKNFKLSIGRYGPPDISGPGAKVVLRFKKRSFVAIFTTNKAFTCFTVKQMGMDDKPFTGTIGIHHCGRCHLHIPYRVASRAEFPLHVSIKWFNSPPLGAFKIFRLIPRRLS